MKRAAAALVCTLAALSIFLIYARRGSAELMVAQDMQPYVPFTVGQARILAVGDMMFDRQIRHVADEKGQDYLFACAEPLMRAADFAVGNLEGPVTAHASVSIGTVPGSDDNFYFTFPTSTADALARNGFRAVSIGNNHILNFGLAGLESTQQYLNLSGVGYFGGVRSDEGIYRTDDNGVPLSFVTYNQFGGSSVKNVVSEIIAERAVGRVVIVYAHWGQEYTDTADTLRPIAQQFAYAGAAAVVGAHPHIVLGHEYLGSTLVYYSLGNFIFDQYWRPDVSHGLALVLYVRQDGTVLADEHPVELEKSGQTCPLV